MTNFFQAKHKVLLFGGQASGKSSLLATIIYQAERLVGHTSLKFERLNSIVLLDKKLQKLRDTATTTREDPITAERIANVGTEPDRYTIGIKRAFQSNQQKDIISLEFIDTSGELWTTDEGSKILDSHFCEARAAILAVDSVELMNKEEVNSLVASRAELTRNFSSRVDSLVKQWISNHPADEKLLLCIVPTKTESYLRERAVSTSTLPTLSKAQVIENQKRLLAAVRSEYSETCRFLGGYDSRIAVVVTPVQIIGTLIFDSYRASEENAYPIELWRRIKREFDPLDCDQPIRHILNFFLLDELRKAQAMAEQQESSIALSAIRFALKGISEDLANVFDRLRTALFDIFGGHEDLALPILQFSFGTKTDPPFHVEFGRALITRDESLLNSLVEFLKAVLGWAREAWGKIVKKFREL